MKDLLLAAFGGVLACGMILMGDAYFRSLDPASFDRLKVPREDWPEALLTGVFYGGSTEEILTR